MTSKLTREELLNIIETDHVQCGEASALARMALAAMDSEPVAEVLSSRPGNDTSTIDRALPVGTQLYRHAQPAPVIPDFETVLEGLDYDVRCNIRESEHVYQASKSTYDACRSAMLQAGNSPVQSEPRCSTKAAPALDSLPKTAVSRCSNSPVIGIDLASGPDYSVEVRYVAPPGYVMVPKEPTERMVIDGFESEPDETFSEPEVWEAYQKMSGCEQAAFRARLCWAAMIAAAL